MPQDLDDENVDSCDSFTSPTIVKKKTTVEKKKSSHIGSSFNVTQRMENVPTLGLAQKRMNNQPVSIALTGTNMARNNNTFAETKSGAENSVF